MQISTRCRYAVMAMVDLASRQDTHHACAPVCLADIATRQQLSLAYLEQLFGKLRKANLVSAARGPGGGYRLTRPSDAIAIADIVSAVDERLSATRCQPASPGCLVAGETQAQCQTHDLWAELGRQIECFLSAISLADVVTGQVVGRAACPRPEVRKRG